MIRSSLAFILLFAFASVPAWAAQNVTTHKVFSGSKTMTGQVFSYPADGEAHVTSMRLEFGPGGDVGWHKHLAPSYIYVIEGTLTIEFAEGKQQNIEQGTGFLPTLDVWHNGRNIGSGPLTALLVINGVKGKRGIVFRNDTSP